MNYNWSRYQRAIIGHPEVTLVGVDQRGRPVVEKASGIPAQIRRWAVTRGGDPVDVTEPVVPLVSEPTTEIDFGSSLHPKTDNTWRITLQFVDDPSVYSQELIGPTTLAQAMAHMPLTVRTLHYTVDHIARVSFTKL